MPPTQPLEKLARKPLSGKPVGGARTRKDVGVTDGQLASRVTLMIPAASQQLFWYFSYPTPLAPGGDRSA